VGEKVRRSNTEAPEEKRREILDNNGLYRRDAEGAPFDPVPQSRDGISG